MAGSPRIYLGQIGGAHGVRGEVRLRSFTSEARAIADYGPLETEDGRTLQIVSLRPCKGDFVARFCGISGRSAAERLTNAKLYVPRERLPPAEHNEFYHADLIGLRVVDFSGNGLGCVIAIHNFGAGDVIEMRRQKGEPTQLLPFNEHTAPVVDLAHGRIVVDAAACDLVTTPPSRERSTTKRSPRG